MAYTTHTSAGEVSYTLVVTSQSGRTVHIASHNGFRIWERIHNKRKQGPCEEDYVCEETYRAEPERAMWNVVAAANEQADNGDGIAEIKQDDTGCDHANLCQR
jgi:hypothetical protein